MVQWFSGSGAPGFSAAALNSAGFEIKFDMNLGYKIVKVKMR